MSRSELERLLPRLADRPVIYVRNPGNAGDALIASATYDLFQRLNIDFEAVDLDCPPERTRGRILFYSGGGNLVKYYSNARDFLLRHHPGAERVVILPHTILGNEDLLRAMAGKALVFCRERTSFAHVAPLLPPGAVHLADDVAFGLDAEQFIRDARHRYLPLISTPGLAVRNAKRLVRRALRCLRRPQRRRELNAFRTDIEATGRHRLPADNFDVSQVFATDNMSRECTDEATYRVLSFLRRFDVIHTDRLHVCIGALLLGKCVNFHDNAYGKNRAVYEQSMRGRYPGLVWHG